MRSVTVLHNQTIQDISIQETGTISNVMAICECNNISSTQLLQVGMIIKIPDNITRDNEIYNYYRNKSIKPATGTTINDGELLFENGLFENGLFQ